MNGKYSEGRLSASALNEENPCSKFGRVDQVHRAANQAQSLPDAT